MLSQRSGYLIFHRERLNKTENDMNGMLTISNMIIIGGDAAVLMAVSVLNKDIA